MTDTKADPGRSRRPAFLMLALGLIGVSICAVSLFANVTLGEAESFIAAPLHSAALANYAKDPIGGRLQSLSIRIIEFAIQDREPETNDAGARATDVVESLKSPVPTVTPKPGDPTYTPTAANTAFPTATIGNTGTLTPTSSPTRTPTRTPTSTPTDLPTAGPSATPTKTPTPGPTSTPTKTPTPSNTPSPSNTPTPCKVLPLLYVELPLDGTAYGLGDEIEGHGHAWDPDNVNPSNCSPTPEVDGSGITRVEFEVKRLGVTVYSHTEFDQAYCAFLGGDPPGFNCNKVSVSGLLWPNSAPITPGVHELWVRARDDEGQFSLWDFTTFTITLLPTATPSPTASNTPAPTFTPTSSNTPIPTPNVCASISYMAFNPSSTDVRWKIVNSTGSTVTITQIELTWPTLNGSLNSIDVEGSTIWSGLDLPPNFTVGASVPIGSGPPNEEIVFGFAIPVQSTGYTLVLTFNGSCTVTAND